VIDPFGRIVNRLPLGVEGVLDAQLPTAIEPTFFLSYGNYSLIFVLIVSLAIAGRRRLRA
jgi:apolipoprotein N-acyltransferase